MFLLVIYRTVVGDTTKIMSHTHLASLSDSEDDFRERRVTVCQELTLVHTGLDLMITLLLSPPLHPMGP